jgi:hypothetical protein
MQQGEHFNEYIDAFEKKLALVSVNDISPALYCKKYLIKLLDQKKYYLSIYADVLYKLASHSSKKKESILLLDYGSGNGLLGIFAKFCGFKKVFLNDHDVNFIHASEKLAAQLNIKIDGYITGDISSVITYFNYEVPNAIVGTDVIEHIYDLEIFFSGIQQLNQSMVSVFTTASNPCNYIKVRSLRKLHLKDELEGGTADDYILSGENTLEPFIKIRENIIRKHIEDLPDSTIIELAKITRGLNEKDIITFVEQYKLSGKPGFQVTRGTNTCNPLTGSWTERILPLETYISLYADAGFTCNFYAGFYNIYETGLRNFVKKLLNAGITTFGKKISPYIVIVGSKK